MRYSPPFFPFVLLLGSGCTVDGGIKVYNSKPEASIGSHRDGDEVGADSTLELWGNVSDGNHDEEELEVTWYDGAEVICATTAPDADGRTTCSSSLALGEHTITLEVRDPANASETASVLLSAVLLDNDAPELSSVTLGPDPAYEGDTLTCTPGAVTDAEGDAVS